MLDLTSLFSRPAFVDLFMLAQQAAAKPASAEPPSLNLGIKFAFIFGVILGAMALGTLLSRLLRMKEATGRLTTVSLMLIVSLSPFVFRLMNGEKISDSFAWGIDLAGGTNLIYEVDRERLDADKQIDNEKMDQTVGAVIRRLNPSGAEEITVRRVGSDRIEVIIPGADQEIVEAKKTMISRLGSLEFGILANARQDKTIIDAARRMPLDQDIYRDRDSKIRAAWRDPGAYPDGTLKPVGTDGEVAVRKVKRRGEEYNQFLVLIDEPEFRITGENLSSVMPSTAKNGSPAVSFRLDSIGARNMSRLTNNRLPSPGTKFTHRLAILLDETVHQAPSINEALSSDIQVSGLRSRAEVRELINILNAGALKVPLKTNPISEYSISPMLGADVQKKGLFAISLAACAVFGFMLIYYMRAGVIAASCLLMNLLLVAAAMSVFHATITLPGLAGLVLTIGMAVDANVLIFERIREELDRGSSQRMAIQNGFAKALSTIIDSNVTTLLTAAILFGIGSDQVKGFAVTLFIGIVMSMFSAIYFGRLLFDIGERAKWLGKLRMFSIVGRTNWDFLGKRTACYVFSTILIVSGMAVFVARGEDNLDIDFTGGVMATFQLDQPSDIETVRKILSTEFDSLSLESLALDGTMTPEGTIFRMRTKFETDEQGKPVDVSQDTIRERVGNAFEGQPIQPLRITLSHGDIAAIEASAAETTAPDSEDETQTEETTPAESLTAFPGGHRVELTFSSEITTTVAATLFQANLSEIVDNGESKYSQPAELFRLTGTAGSGIDTASQAVQKFESMQLEVSPTVPLDDLQIALASWRKQMDEHPTFDEISSFDTAVAGEMQTSAIMAVLASLVMIVFYIWIRFGDATFGLAAVAALAHDVLAVLGLVAIGSYLATTPIGPLLGLVDFKINLAMIAAFLTIVGYSLNDTIVVFDRIREVRGKSPAFTPSMVNHSLNQTLSRTLLTSLTTWIVVIILYIWGGEGIHGFAYCLVVGVLVGTYSSIYVASPLLLWLINRPGSEIGQATAKAEAEELAKAEKQAAV